MKKFIFASDLHGDMQDYDSVQALYEFCEIFQPDLKVFGGDLFDFRAIRRGAGKAERSESIASDVEAGLDFLGKFEPNVFLLGNHDKRLWDTASNSMLGLESDYAKQGVKDITKRCKSMKCKMIPYDARCGFYEEGKIRYIHGFAAGIYASKKHAETYAPEGGIVLHGHTHAIQYHSVPKVGSGAGMGVGCLAKTDMDYNKHQIGRILHQNGFAYGYFEKKEWMVLQAKKGENGKWQILKDIKTIG